MKRQIKKKWYPKNKKEKLDTIQKDFEYKQQSNKHKESHRILYVCCDIITKLSNFENKSYLVISPPIEYYQKHFEICFYSYLNMIKNNIKSVLIYTCISFMKKTSIKHQNRDCYEYIYNNNKNNNNAINFEKGIKLNDLLIDLANNNELMKQNTIILIPLEEILSIDLSNIFLFFKKTIKQRGNYKVLSFQIHLITNKKIILKLKPYQLNIYGLILKHIASELIANDKRIDTTFNCVCFICQILFDTYIC